MGWIGYLSISLLVVIILLSVFLYLLYRNQERLIFYPEKLPKNYTFGFENTFEEINFQVKKQVTLNGLLFKAIESKGLIIYCHGNAGSNASWGHRAKDFTKHGWDVLVWDYRSYGKSDGYIKREEILHNDADFIYQTMIKKYNPNNIAFVGCSLGTGVAARLASKYQSKFLLLITPYFNFKQVVDYHYPLVPTSLVLKYHFHSDKYLKQVNCKIYLIHGTNDETVPYESSVMLAQVVPHNTKLITIDGGMHNNLPETLPYQQIIAEVLN